MHDHDTPAPEAETKVSRRTNKLDAALAWVERTGCAVFPLVNDGKTPLPGSRGHLSATTNLDVIENMWTGPLVGTALDHNIGCRPHDGIVIVDLDEKEGRNGRANYEALGGVVGGLVVRTPSGGFHVWCAAPHAMPNTAGKLAVGVDTRGPDGYCVAPGSTINGVAYEIVSDGDMLPVPQFVVDKVGLRTERRVAVNTANVEDDLPANVVRFAEVCKQAAPAFDGVWHDASRNLACEAARLAVSCQTAIETMLEYWVPRGSDFYKEGRSESWPGDVHASYAWAVAQGDHGTRALLPPSELFSGVVPAPAEPECAAPATATPGIGHNGADDVPATRYSHDALALAFSEQHAENLRYVPEACAWFVWDGARWAKDPTLSVYDKARALCRRVASEAATDRSAGDGVAQSLTSAPTISAVERLARSDRRHVRQADAFDSDPWALNTPGGVVDLRTGAIRPHNTAEAHTKVAGATPGGDCPRWLAFLDEITQGDAALIGYLQRFAGYTLTGVTREQAFLFAYGPGGNGKGVLFGTMAALLGDYATTAQADLFTVQHNEQHPTALAALRGARLVAVTETEAGRRWAEAKLKAVTGGDRITARVMRGDPFEFEPVCKLWFSGNHKPPLRNPDKAMRRRMHLVPMLFVPAAPDSGLPDALRAELPGIMAWAVQGCLDWQRQGLRPPYVVTRATDEYFASQDGVAEWLAERCEFKPGATAKSAALFVSWRDWARARNEEPGTQVWFSEAMERHAAKRRTMHGVVFEGLRLLTSFQGATGGVVTG